MNAQINGVAGRSPARRKTLPPSEYLHGRSSSAFFRFSSRISRAAAVVVPSAWPASTSACRIHFRSVSGFIPNRPATALIASYSEA